jgi:hypothetical protein
MGHSNQTSPTHRTANINTVKILTPSSPHFTLQSILLPVIGLLIHSAPMSMSITPYTDFWWCHHSISYGLWSLAVAGRDILPPDVHKEVSLKCKTWISFGSTNGLCSLWIPRDVYTSMNFGSTNFSLVRRQDTPCTKTPALSIAGINTS